MCQSNAYPAAIRLRVFYLLAFVFSSCLWAQQATSKAQPKHEAVAVLSNGILSAEVMLPNAPNRYNQGTRFSNVANVLRIVKDGQEFLYSPIEHNPLTDNGGLAMEFGKSSPVGFEEARIGEPYLKIGVGVLRKSADEYNFYAQQELIQAAETTVQWNQDKAVFHQESPIVNGYGYRLTVTVELIGNTLQVLYRLENSGSRTLKSEQYAHNFFAMDTRLISNDYSVHFQDSIEHADIQKGNPILEGSSISFPEDIQLPIAIDIPQLKKHSDYSVEVAHKSGPSIIATTTGIDCYRTFVYAKGSYLCPEQFIKLNIRPHESVSWQRDYTFNN